jgi:hypothetical protein
MTTLGDTERVATRSGRGVILAPGAGSSDGPQPGSGVDLQGTLVGITGQIIGVLDRILSALRDSPGGFGLILIPLGILWGIAVMASRRGR